MAYNREKVRNLLDYVERVNRKRGELINETINLENVFNSLIATYFCNDETKRKELLSLIICKRLNLAAKITIVKEIVNKHFKPLLEIHPSLFRDMEKIKKMRNDLAHMTLPVNLESGENLKKKVVELRTHESEIRTILERDIDEAIYLAKHYMFVFSLNAIRHSSAT